MATGPTWCGPGKNPNPNPNGPGKKKKKKRDKLNGQNELREQQLEKLWSKSLSPVLCVMVSVPLYLKVCPTLMQVA